MCMDVKEFESQYREQVRDILNRLQAVVLVAQDLETAIVNIGDSIQSLSHDVESFLAEHSTDDSESQSED